MTSLNDHHLPAEPPSRPKEVQRTPGPRRFACFTIEDGVYESATGEHVAYSDYERLAQSLDALLAALHRLLKAIEEINQPETMDGTEYERAAARAAIAKAES